jgi:hypothetical protein
VEGANLFKTLTRLLLVLIIAAGLFWFFAPRFFSNAANSIVSSIDPSVAQAQGLAQFVPAGSTTMDQGKSGDLQVNISSLEPDTTYDITLDQGQCGVESKDLGQVTTDDNGNFYAELPLKTLDTSQTWFVDIHDQDAQGSSVACGQLQTNQDASNQAGISAQPGTNVFNGSQPLPNDSGNADSTPTTTPSTPSGLPNTGANPGSGQYDNNTNPRKY